MINIRYALTGALLLFGSATLASAQQPKGVRHVPGAQELGGQLLKGITLSDAEKGNVKAVQSKYASQMKALREQFKPQMQATRDARQEQTKQLMLAERADLRAALTPANQTTFDANVAALDKRVAARGAKGATLRRRPPVHALR